MNIYRVRFSTSEIFFVQAESFLQAVQKAITIGREEPRYVKYLGPVRNG